MGGTAVVKRCLFALALIAPPASAQDVEGWPGYQIDPVVRPAKETLGPGPHTLVISDRQGMTRIDYPTGARCIKARDAVRKQTAPPPNRPGVIYGPSSVSAFCVPR